jgi:hypothetical protein
MSLPVNTALPNALATTPVKEQYSLLSGSYMISTMLASKVVRPEATQMVVTQNMIIKYQSVVFWVALRSQRTFKLMYDKAIYDPVHAISQGHRAIEQTAAPYTRAETSMVAYWLRAF